MRVAAESTPVVSRRPQHEGEHRTAGRQHLAILGDFLLLCESHPCPGLTLNHSEARTTPRLADLSTHVTAWA